MKTYARIENGEVVEIIKDEKIEGKYHPSLTWVEADDSVKTGWLYENEVFREPENPNVPIEPQIDPEKLALYEAIAGLEERLRALEGSDK